MSKIKELEGTYLSIKFNNPIELKELCEQGIKEEKPLTITANFSIYKDKPTKPDYVGKKDTDFAVWIMKSKY